MEPINNGRRRDSDGGTSLVERRALFISHASPEDNTFTIWLGAKLAALGYEVWADVLRLSGGNDWERMLENAIRERACKVLLVANSCSVDKQGVRNELHIATDVARKIGDDNFVIPLRLSEFDAPFLVAHAQYIDFEPSWAAGLHKLSKELQEIYSVPRSTIANVGLWKDLQLIHGRPIAEKPEQLVSNWLAVRRLPPRITYVRSGQGGNVPGTAQQYPSVDFDHGVLAAASIPSETSVPIDAFLGSGWPSLGISGDSGRRLFTELSNRALGNLFRAKGLQSCEMSSRRVAWWLPKGASEGRVAFRWSGVSGMRQLQGYSRKRNIFWHFGASTAFRNRPFAHVRLKSHLIFTADGLVPLKDPGRMHRFRRSFARSWRNARWRDMMLAFLSLVGEGTTVLNVPCGSGEDDLVLSLPPVSFSSPVSISEASCSDEDSDDPELSPDDDLTLYEDQIEEGINEPT